MKSFIYPFVLLVVISLGIMTYAEQKNVSVLPSLDYLLGSMYLNRIGVAENPKEALRLFIQAGKQGHVKSQYQVYKLYLNGNNPDDENGVKPNERQAYLWLLEVGYVGKTIGTKGMIDIYLDPSSSPKAQEDAWKWITRVAEQGNALAQLNLVRWYIEGEGLAQDLEKAEYWLERSANVENESLKKFRGTLQQFLESHYELHENYKEMRYFLSLSAEQGDAEAQYKLGDLYEKGLGGATGPEEALKWYKKAAEQGHSVAQTRVEHLYEQGFRPSQGYQKAVEWLEKIEERNTEQEGDLKWNRERLKEVPSFEAAQEAAKSGEPESQFTLGSYHEKGHGTPENLTQAMLWYQKAAEQGWFKAQMALARLYSDKYNPSKDDAKAAHWSRKATEQGYAQAPQELGSLEEEIKNDLERFDAPAWVLNEERPNDEYSQKRLADRYYVGIGVPRNLAKAFYWYQRAIENNSYSARSGFLSLYEKGHGIAQDYERVVQWYAQTKKDSPEFESKLLRLHEFGEKQKYEDAEILYLFGEYFENAEYVEYSDLAEIKAEFWFKKAGEQGMLEAQLKAGEMSYLDLSPDGTEPGRVYWYRKAAMQGSSKAQYKLGQMYHKGDEVSPDDEEAVKWFLLAAPQGHANAQLLLAVAYENGKGVKQDYHEALKWYREYSKKQRLGGAIKRVEAKIKAQSLKD